MVSKIVRELESLGESEITSETIGETVMEHLRELDDVAYVRFASVYRNFREAKDFETGARRAERRGRAAKPRRAQAPSQQNDGAAARRGDAGPLPPIPRTITASCSLRSRSAAAGSATPGPIRRSARWSSKDGVDRRPRLDAARRPAACRDRGAEARRRGGAGATLYVTLEPCSHHGKTPPCADAIIAAGIARVVSALEDPNPEVAGRGPRAAARARASRSRSGSAPRRRARAHAGHIRRMRDGRPHVTLKLAVSADGKAGLAGPQARRRSPARRRARACT